MAKMKTFGFDKFVLVIHVEKIASEACLGPPKSHKLKIGEDSRRQ